MAVEREGLSIPSRQPGQGVPRQMARRHAQGGFARAGNDSKGLGGALQICRQWQQGAGVSRADFQGMLLRPAAWQKPEAAAAGATVTGRRVARIAAV